MSFLQPWLLLALPLIAIPLVIHLIHRRRHQRIEWAAMMFLIEAARAVRGWRRLRHFLILLFRTLAVAALIFVISRPLAGGWLGMAAGGPADAIYILVDRSASMGVRSLQGGTKLAEGLTKLVATYHTIRANHWVLIDSVAEKPLEIEKPKDLLSLPIGTPTAASADVPAMLLTALAHQKANHFGRTEIWILSDTQAHDWRPESSEWDQIRSELAASRQVRVMLLAYARPARVDAGIRVTRLLRTQDDEGAALLFDLVIRRTPADPRKSVQVEFDLGGARSVLEAPLQGLETHVDGHRIPLDPAAPAAGWGRVQLPADDNESDDAYYFVYGEEPPRRTTVIAEDADVGRLLALVAASPLNPAWSYPVTTATFADAEQTDFSGAALLIWQGPLPTGDLADEVRRFVDTEGRALFLPPRHPTATELFGSRWTRWDTGLKGDAARVDRWQDKGDLLADAASGRSLPVGEIHVAERCVAESKGVVLARFGDGVPLLTRAITPHGGAYFLATLPTPGTSSMITEPVVLYALVQRLLESGVSRCRSWGQREPGTIPQGAGWRAASNYPENVLSIERPWYPGVLERAGTEGTEMFAINRSLEEDQSPAVAAPALDRLFAGADFVRVDQKLGAGGNLVEEIWRIFLMAMIALLLAESCLCLFDVRRARPATGGGAR